MGSAWRPEFRPHLWAASGSWRRTRSRSKPGGEQLPLQLAPPAQSWEELAGASVVYVRPLFLDKHSSVFESISPAFLTLSFRFLAASQPCALGRAGAQTQPLQPVSPRTRLALQGSRCRLSTRQHALPRSPGQSLGPPVPPSTDALLAV